MACQGRAPGALKTRVIVREQMLLLLIEASPSYRLPEENQELLYVMLGNFADHLLKLYKEGHAEELSAVARVIERLHIEGDHEVREAATIGLLEGIQNGWSHSDTDPELFVPYLLPVSAKWWRSLNDFWSGKSKFVGEGL